METNEKDILPHCENAVIPDAKIFDYVLNGEHPLGRNKAVVFESALGFNQRNGYLLIGKIKQALKKYPAIEAGTDQYGRRYNVDMEISGPNGMTAWVRTAWILPVEGNVPRLITLFVLKQMR